MIVSNAVDKTQILISRLWNKFTGSINESSSKHGGIKSEQNSKFDSNVIDKNNKRPTI